MSAEAVNPASERATVIAALQRASAATGSDFHYLLGTAMRESSLKPQAQAGRSSAVGLFQFVEQTWLRLVKAVTASTRAGRATPRACAADRTPSTAALIIRLPIFASLAQTGTSPQRIGSRLRSEPLTVTTGIVCVGQTL